MFSQYSHTTYTFHFADRNKTNDTRMTIRAETIIVRWGQRPVIKGLLYIEIYEFGM